MPPCAAPRAAAVVLVSLLLFAVTASFPQTAPARPGPTGSTAPGPLDEQVRAASAGFRGTVHIYAKNIDTGATYSLRGDERVRTASTIKLPIMVTVFAQVAAGTLRWDQEVVLTKEKKVSGSGVPSASSPTARA